ncbi:glycosyltransferase family 39 protein [Candidatus Woesebacteria bacterium]|nr:glycosyltransferase family 39 protein [Candidatus Woesebacteria bacterium]
MNQFTASLWGDEAFSAVLSQKSVPDIISIITRDTSPPLFNILEHFWFKVFGTSEVSIRSLVFILFLVTIFFIYKIGAQLWDKMTGFLAAILVLWGNRKVSISLFKSFITIGILYIPWLIPLYQQTKIVGGGFWLGKPNLIDLRNLIYKYLAEGINNPLREPALYLVGLILIFRNWLRGPEKSFIIASWFLLPILLTWVVSQKFTPIFFERYLVYTAPAAMILVSSEKGAVTKYLIALLISLFLIIDFNYYTHPTKRPFRELAGYIMEVKRGDDYLINWNSSAHHLWESKYYGLNAPLYVPGNKELPFFVGTALMTKDDILRSIPNKNGSIKTNRVGVITSGPVDEIMIAGYTKSEVKTFGELKYVVFIK